MSATPTAIGSGPAWLRRKVGEATEQMKLARRIAIVSGTVVVVCTAVLIADYAVGAWRTARQTARIVELEGQTKGDAEVAAVLHDERKAQTDESLARETRGRALAWVLLLAGGVFVGSGKWWVSLGAERVPTLEELVAVRFGGVSGGSREQKTQGAGAEEVAAAGARDEGQGNGAAEMVAPGSQFGRDQGNVAPETIDLEFIDGLIDRFGRDREAAIPILQAIQSHFRYLPDEALRHVCEHTEITPAQIAGTSSFYSQFRRSPVGRHVVRVCHGTACHVAGAEQITEELRRHLDIPPGEDTDSQRLFTLDKVACVGCCSLAPVMMIEEDTAGRLTPATARQTLDTVAKRT
jgi:NADH:ubiquinone oxidoreductase subunit E